MLTISPFAACDTCGTSRCNSYVCIWLLAKADRCVPAPKSTQTTTDAILNARLMVHLPHRNFGPSLDLLREHGEQRCASGGVALRRLETALRRGDTVRILLPNKAPVQDRARAAMAFLAGVTVAISPFHSLTPERRVLSVNAC